ncbi:CDP-alcohol phosphatidyltransferase [Flavobacteriaceae bacterium R38]|nr:CDP-alcohol phosphatidyltransferase [Flavobacteriaceae bacterium R38]
MKNLPFLLIYSRIVIALLIGSIAYLKVENFRVLIVVLMIVGLLTDIFDGIIARKLEVSSEKLRIWDSNVDQFFWIVVIASVFYLNSIFIKENYLPILIIVALEVLAYIISYLKFKRTIATHSILAKFWTITLLIFLIDLVLNSNSNLLFLICIILGVVSRIEIIMIILSLKKWATDIPSIFLVRKINRGEVIKKNKLFNG